MITSRDLILETVRFYSMRMLVVHLKYLSASETEFRQELVEQFKRTHMHETLTDYIEEKFKGNEGARGNERTVHRAQSIHAEKVRGGDVF